MARYIGPVCRLCRRSGEKLFLKGERCVTPKCGVEKRPKPAGQQRAGRPRRLSDRGVQLREKQKIRYNYGMLERQFRRFFAEAEKRTGVTGETLMVLLERRLDNTVLRLGFADSRAQARQLVEHGHFLVNGRRTNIPSYWVKEGEIISWREGSTKTKYYKMAKEVVKSKTIPNWLNLDKENMVGRVVSLPTSEGADVQFEVERVVEYYSR